MATAGSQGSPLVPIDMGGQGGGDGHCARGVCLLVGWKMARSGGNAAGLGGLAGDNSIGDTRLG